MAKKYDVDQLKRKDVKQKFTIELRNRFACLEVEESHEPTYESMENEWKTTKTIYKETAEKVLGFKKRNRKPWISSKTLDLIDDRRLLKNSVYDAKSERIRDRRTVEYRDKAREIK